MKIVLVTGGAGFIGGHVVEALADRYKVLVVDNRWNGRLIVNHPNVRYHYGGVIEYSLTKHVDYIIHLAAWSNVRESMNKPFRLYADNVMSTASIIEDVLVGKQKVKSLVFASSSAAVNPESHYGVSKMASEEMLDVFHHQTGIPVSLLRFANVYGPRQSPVNGTLISNLVQCLQGGNSPTIYGDGSQERDYIYVADLVAAIIICMENCLDCCSPIATGTGVSVNDVVATAVDAATLLGLSLPSPEYKDAKPGDKDKVSMEFPEHLQVNYGWKPEMPLRRGILEQIKWAKSMKGVWKDDHHPDGSIAQSKGADTT